MALPANVTTVVVLGTFLTPEGNPSTGTISFTASSWLTNSGANIAIPNSTVSKTLGTAGNFSVSLPITDDPDLSPSGFVYNVSEVVDGVSQNYNISIPGTIAGGGTLFLADLAPVAPAGPEYYSLASSLSIGSVTTLAAGSAATATITGLAPAQTLNLGIPTGPTGNTGATGPQGNTGTLAVGSVTSVANSGTASVTNVGSSTAGTFDFVLRDGPTGATGAQGNTGTLAVGIVTSVANSHINRNANRDTYRYTVRDPNAHAYRDTDRYGDKYAYSYSIADPDGDTYRDTNAHSYADTIRNTDSHPKRDPDSNSNRNANHYSNSHDRGSKRLLYEALGVREYWIVDVERAEIVALAVRDRGSYRIEESLVLPGLKIALLEEGLRRSRSNNHGKVSAWLLTQWQ